MYINVYIVIHMYIYIYIYGKPAHYFNVEPSAPSPKIFVIGSF